MGILSLGNEPINFGIDLGW